MDEETLKEINDTREMLVMFLKETRQQMEELRTRIKKLEKKG